MVSEVYMICVAYEAGVGKGRDLRFKGTNPYDNSPGINAQCHEAWDYGIEEGRRQVARAGAVKEGAS